jgi:predicted SnoaL-like aldol condensation-catalyzing enzyme
MTNTEKALALVNSFTTGDTTVAQELLAPDYIQHNLNFATGAAGFIDAVAGLAQAPEKTTLTNVRSFEDGDFVFLHSVVNFAGSGDAVAMDVFRFENGKIAEHWDNVSPVVAPNPSGHTQTDGYTLVEDLDKTEANKTLVDNFVRDVLRGEAPEKITDYLSTEEYTQHNSTIADGLDGLSAALGEMAANGIEMILDDTPMLHGQGNFVLAGSVGSFAGVPTVYYDLFRVKDGKIVEHWDVMEELPPRDKWANDNGKF